MKSKETYSRKLTRLSITRTSNEKRKSNFKKVLLEFTYSKSINISLFRNIQ